VAGGQYRQACTYWR